MARLDIPSRFLELRVRSDISPADRAARWTRQSERLKALAARPAAKRVDPASLATRVNRFKKG
jgi:hypothetical protein